MTTRISQQQLESYLWGAAVLLRGTIDAGDYKQFIFPLLFYKRLCDVFDEETQTALAESGDDAAFAAYPENHRFQIPPEAHWRTVRQSPQDVGRVLQTALRAIETANPDKLYGIFGDAQWTNKDRLSDAMLRDLVEHLAALDLTIANLPEDELGQGYEYLIKKFADDSGHTAAEFYTNRTVVHLMTELLQPQSGESIYDPTCGSGGMLLSCIAHLRQQGQEWRNVRLYGQERNLMTSSIARMNCFLHGIEDFRIERGDTLAAPKFVQGDRLMRFDVVLANPPYSIKQWDRAAFAADPWGRNRYGTPPQGRADYAFWQHILLSLVAKTGRCAILFPHGVLFRQEEADMRRKLIEADLIECVLGLGPNLFYNSPMEACVVICRTAKPKAHRGKILFINAVNEVTRERAQSFLTDDHIQHIVKAYEQFKGEPGFAHATGLDEIRTQDFNLNIALYIMNTEHRRTAMRKSEGLLDKMFSAWLTGASDLRKSLASVLGEAASKPLPSVDDVKVREPAWLDRSKWHRVRLGDVVRQVRDRVADASTEGITHYVPGGGISAQDFRITEWREIGDGLMGPAFHMRFKPGHVLYKSRVPHGVAVADHTAICANTTYVLDAISEHLEQRLLPFLLVIDEFRQFEKDNNRGSTNLFLNYSDIAKFEFALPPLDQQRRIAEILWAVYEVIQQASAAEMDAQSLADASLADFLYNTEQWSQSECRDILVDGPRNGFSPPANADGSGLPTLSISAIRGGKVVTDGSVKFASVGSADVSRFQLQSGDMLVVRGNGNRFLCGKAGIVREYPEGCFYPDLLIRLRFKPNVMLQEFAVIQWNEPKTYARLISKAKSTNGIWKINGQDIKSHRLSVPPIAAQERFLDAIKSKYTLVTSLNDSVGKGMDLLKQMTNAIFGGQL